MHHRRPLDRWPWLHAQVAAGLSWTVGLAGAMVLVMEPSAYLHTDVLLLWVWLH